MRQARTLRVAIPAALALGIVAVLTSIGGPAADVSAAERAETFVDHPSLVSETPRRDLPVILNPRDPDDARANEATLAIDLIDGFIVSGGNFQDQRLPNGQVLRQPHLTIWDDLNGTLHCRGLTPDNDVLAIAAGPTAASVIIAGRFNTITDPNGVVVTRRKIAKIDLATCTVDQDWAVPAPNSRISELATVDGRLFLGGNFTAIGETPVQNLAEVSLATGALNPAFSFIVEGDANRTMIVGMDVKADGSRLGVVHKARTIDGAPQRATAIFDITDPGRPTLTAHQLDQTSIPWRFNWLIQDGAFSPDFSRVIVANGTQVLEADQITLALTTEAPGQFEWVKNMWDTTFAIDISNNAVYAGGHFCAIEPGPGPTDLMAPNGLDRCTGVAFGGTAWRSQLAAFSLADGTPLRWNPGSNAYKGIVTLKVVSRGLLIGQDGSRINSFNVGTTAFLDFGRNTDDVAAPAIVGASWSVGDGELTVDGTVTDDIRGRFVRATVRADDGRWLQANGALANSPHTFDVTPEIDGAFLLTTTIPSGRFELTLTGEDHAGRTSPSIRLAVEVDGNQPADGACIAETVGGQVQLRWGAFNGEDDNYAVRTAAGWVATVAAGDREWTGPAGTYLIRSREGGQTVDVRCGDDDPGPGPDPEPVDPACRATPGADGVRLAWDIFNNEDDSYQVRTPDSWLATVDADVRSVDVNAEPPVLILSREGGVTETLECAWTVDAEPLRIPINKPATQSSTYAGQWIADWAIDGNTDGIFNNRSVSSTGLDAEAWWQAELDAPTSLDEIQVWNRTGCCPNRLGSAHIFISDADMTGRAVAELLADPAVTTFVLPAEPGTVESVALGGVTGTFVKIQLPRTDYLTIAEVILFG